jgi:hypothetical protein
MSGEDLSDVCRQIAAEHADRLIRGEARGAGASDPLALIGRLDAYADVLRDLSEAVPVEGRKDSPR